MRPLDGAILIVLSKQVVHTVAEQVGQTRANWMSSFVFCPHNLLRFLPLAFYAFHPHCPKMSLSKKRKVETGCRVFQERWSSSYFFVEVNGKVFVVFTTCCSAERI